MSISCLLGRHWPVAAFSPPRDEPARSRCADCGVPMAKHGRTDWHARAQTMPWLWRRFLRDLGEPGMHLAPVRRRVDLPERDGPF